MITIDPNLHIGGKAIADNIVDIPVEVLWLGRIFARVKDCVTGYEWELMANRLRAVDEPTAVIETTANQKDE